MVKEFVCKVYSLTVFVYSLPVLHSLSDLAPSPHRQRQKIVFVGNFGRPPIARRLEMVGLGGVHWSARRGGAINWSL